MYPKDKKTAAMMSETIREVLADKDLMCAIMENSEEKPVYWDLLPQQNGITAIVVAQMIRAMAGDTSAFTALSRFGFGEKVQMEVSDFYRANKIDINVINPETVQEGQIDAGEIGKQAFDAVTKGLEEGSDDNTETSETSKEEYAPVGEEIDSPDANKD